MLIWAVESGLIFSLSLRLLISWKSAWKLCLWMVSGHHLMHQTKGIKLLFSHHLIYYPEPIYGISIAFRKSNQAPSQKLHSVFWHIYLYIYLFLIKEVKRLDKIERTEEHFAFHRRKEGLMYCNHFCNLLIWGSSPSHSQSKFVFVQPQQLSDLSSTAEVTNSNARQ